MCRAQLGSNDEALELLERAYVERDPILSLAKLWPGFNVLHDHPRFQEVLKRMGLE